MRTAKTNQNGLVLTCRGSYIYLKYTHIYMSSTANATLFFLSIFKTDNNLKNIMTNYHLHTMSIFLHYQIRFSCAHARIRAFEYESAFSVLHVHMLIFFKKKFQNQNQN